eukprot:353150-Chlamydomonas_euryale.AAC.4
MQQHAASNPPLTLTHAAGGSTKAPATTGTSGAWAASACRARAHDAAPVIISTMIAVDAATLRMPLQTAKDVQRPFPTIYPSLS